MKRVCVSLLLACAPAFGQVSIDALVDSSVEHVRTEFNVPAISVAVVKDGKSCWRKAMASDDLVRRSR
jgi:hypothetical protein